MRKVVGIFLKEVGISKEVSEGFARAFASLFEWDDIYLIILQDLASETSAEKLIKNPGKEISRLLNLFKERDARDKMHDTFSSSAKLLKLAFLYPKLKRAFIKAIKEIEFKNLQMDDGDRYWALRLIHYNAMGRTFEDRTGEFMKIHNGVHPRMLLLQHDADRLAQQNELRTS